MKRTISCILALAVVLSLLSVPAFAMEGGRGIIYIAENGNDNAAGTIDAPLATFGAARDKIREMKASGKYTKGFTVYVRGGTYNFSDNLVFEEPDSGTEQYPTVWRNYEDEKVTITGGISVSGSKFKKVTDSAVLSRIVDSSARNNVYSIDLKQLGITEIGDVYLPGAYSYNTSVTNLGLAKRPSAPPMEIIFNGTPMVNARYPNTGNIMIEQVLEPGYDFDNKEAFPAGTPFKIVIKDDRPKYWTQAPKDSALMYGFWKWQWADQTIPLREFDASKNIITSAWHSVFSVITGSTSFYVFNLLEELDMPGEYYIDRDNSILYINPPADLKTANVMLSILEKPLIVFKNAKNITIKGFDIVATRNNAIYISGGENNKVVDCDISYTAVDAVAIASGKNNGIRDCYIHDVNGGISLSGGDIATLTPGGNYAINNHIENFARIDEIDTPAIGVSGVGQRANHNEVHGATHMAIGYGGQNNELNYNEIYDVLRQTDDAGVFYGGLNWESRGIDIKYNYIHDVTYGGTGGVGNAALYGDGAQGGLNLVGNVIENFEGMAVLLNSGWNNVVMNNYIINCEKGIFISDVMMRSVNGFEVHHRPKLDKVKEQIWDSPQWREQFPELFEMLKLSDEEIAVPTDNVVINNISYNTPIGVENTSDWADLSQNLRLKSDPGFMDMLGRDYNLKSDSELFKQLEGFVAVPFTRMGRLDDRANARIKDAIVLSVGSPRTLVNGQKGQIDENRAVVPFVHDGRTYVPLRFLAEALGATVDYVDGHITISSADINLEMDLGSSNAVKNGEKVILDAVPQILENRTMVPLRQISELLDKAVFWHESGFISISDDNELFDTVGDSDEEVIIYLNEQVEAY